MATTAIQLHLRPIGSLNILSEIKFWEVDFPRSAGKHGPEGYIGTLTAIPGPRRFPWEEASFHRSR